MAQQQQRPQRRKITDVNSRREGNRWIGERPPGADVASWFHESVRLDPEMKHEDWVGGIVLISSTEKTLGLDQGQIVDVERLVHVPYVRVDARISYFWELCDQREQVGEILPISPPRSKDDGYRNEHLPPGFGRLPIKLPDGKLSHYLTCTQKVNMYKPDLRAGDKGRLVRNSPPATKQVAMTNRYGYPDDNLVMKTETGAVGRALGMAGIFVLPGSGVATAEDMAEFLASTGPGSVPAGDQEPALPDDANGGSQAQDTVARIAELVLQLEQEKPEEYDRFVAWATEKGINPDEPRPAQQRALLRKLEGYFDAAPS